jgi:hypothetical protein
MSQVEVMTEYSDLPMVGENIYTSSTAINQALRKRHKRARERLVSSGLESGWRVRRTRKEYIKKTNKLIGCPNLTSFIIITSFCACIQ